MRTKREDVGNKVLAIGEDVIQGKYGKENDIDLDALREDLEEVLDEADDPYPPNGPDDEED